MSVKIVLSRKYMSPPIFKYRIVRAVDKELFENLGLREAPTGGPVEIDDLPISENLKCQIKKWNEEYQATFNMSNPAISGFNHPELNTIHQETGAIIAEQLQKELGKLYFVEYMR